MGIHLHLPRLASCLFWPIAKSGLISPILKGSKPALMKTLAAPLTAAPSVVLGLIAKSGANVLYKNRRLRGCEMLA